MNETAKESITIDPIQELLKAIEIVHGPIYARFWQNVIWKWEDSHKFDAVEWDA